MDSLKKSKPPAKGTVRVAPGIIKRPGLTGPAYQVRVRKTGFPTFSKTFSKLEDAKAWRSSVETKLNTGEAVATAKAGRYTIDEVLHQYESQGQELSESKRYTLRQLAPEFQGVAVKNLTPDLLTNWLKKKAQEVVPSPKSKKDPEGHHPLYDGAMEKRYSDSSLRKFYVSARQSRLDDGRRCQVVASGTCQQWGNSSSTRLAGCVGSRSRTSRRYA